MAKEPEWPHPRHATQEQREQLSQSLQEHMSAKGFTHITLARAAKTTPGEVRAVLTLRRMPSESMAMRYAKLFGTTVGKLLVPKGPYKPYDGIRGRKLNGKGHKSAAATSDSRWLLPSACTPPYLKMETSKRPAMMVIEVKAEVPQSVALAISSMVNDYKLEGE